MEIKQVFLKTRAEFGKQCFFDTWGPHTDEEIKPDPAAMPNFITRSHCNIGVLHTRQFALHEVRSVGANFVIGNEPRSKNEERTCFSEGDISLDLRDYILLKLRRHDPNVVLSPL